MMKKIRTVLWFVLSALLGVPLLVSAQTGIDTGPLATGYVVPFVKFINDLLVPALMAVALIVFLWGVFKYFILGAENEDDRKTGRQFVLWGIIGFAVILSVWGLVNLTLNLFGLDTVVHRPDYPTL